MCLGFDHDGVRVWSRCVWCVDKHAGSSKFPGGVEISCKRTYLVMVFPIYYRLQSYDIFSLKSEPHLNPPPRSHRPRYDQGLTSLLPKISRASKNFMETGIFSDGLSYILSATMLWSLSHWHLSNILILPTSQTQIWPGTSSDVISPLPSLVHPTKSAGDGLSRVLSVAMIGSFFYWNLSHMIIPHPLIPPPDPTDPDMTR